MIEYYKKEMGVLKRVAEEDAEYALVLKTEYNGYLNAIRIVRDRALQQINKSMADDHGYRLLRAEQDRYRNMKLPIWRVSKLTPYSSKISLECVKSMIEKDINQYYHGILGKNLDEQSLLFDVQLYRDKKIENTPEIEERLELCRTYNGTFVFDVARYTVNFSIGMYEVTYLASDLI